jgi:branched-chain amino acid transport system ATP-binding protein
MRHLRTFPAQSAAAGSSPEPALAATALLRLRDVVASYGAIQALRGISLEVHKGEIVTMLGGNGAGKSTTLRTISGLMHPRSGSVELDGHDVTTVAAHKLVRLGIGHAPEGRRIFNRLTVLENLQMGAYSRVDKAEIASDYDRVFGLFPRLQERHSQSAGTLSGGEQQMLAIGRALMGRPKLLLLDEPSMGLAPVLVEQIFRIIRDINSQGTTILLVEQNAQMALQVAGRGYILQTGKIVLADTAAALAQNEQVKKAYLGG